MELTAEEVFGTIKKAHRANQPLSVEWLTPALDYVSAHLAEFSTNSGALIYPLCCLLSQPYPTAVKEKICQILERANRPESRETIFQVWINQRAPELEELLRRKNWSLEIIDPEYKTLYALKFNHLELLSRETAQLKRVINACEDEDSQISSRAARWLERINTRELMELIAVKWSTNRQPIYLDLLAKNKHFANSPSLIIPLALRSGQLEIIANQGWEVARMFDRLATERSTRLAASLHESLRNLRTKESQEILCRWVIEYEIPVIQRAAVAAGYAPEDLTDRVLFYFLTEQWNKYEALDFDGRVMRQLYKTAVVKQRNRIASLIRKSGRVAYLQLMPHDREILRSESNTVYEGQVVVSVLENNQRWPELWQQVFELPVIWSIFALRILAKNNWMPDNIEEREVFQRLKELARGEIITSAEQLTHLSFGARPLGEATNQQHSEVVALLNSGKTFSSVVQRSLLYIETALRYRYRHAIELDLLPQVQATEFDIELEVEKDQNERFVCRTLLS